jgi:hypothetical protein
MEDDSISSPTDVRLGHMTGFVPRCLLLLSRRCKLHFLQRYFHDSLLAQRLSLGTVLYTGSEMSKT